MTSAEHVENKFAKKYDMDAAFILYMGKMPLDQIAPILNIPEKHLVDQARRRSWFHKRAMATQKAKFAVEQDLQKKIENYKIKHLNFMVDTGEEIQGVIEKIDLEECPGAVGAKLELIEKHHNIQSKVLKLDEPDKTDPNSMGFHVLIALQKRGNNGHNLVNDTIEVDTEVVSSHNNKSPEIGAYSRSDPLTESEAYLGLNKLALASYKQVSEANSTVSEENSTKSGESKIGEQKASITELAKELGISKGTALPPIKWD